MRVNHIAALFLNALTADYRQEFENFYKGRSDNQGSSPPVTTGLIKPSRKPECLFTRRRGDMKPLNWSGQTTPLSKKIGQRGPTTDERSEGIVSLFFFFQGTTRETRSFAWRSHAAAFETHTISRVDGSAARSGHDRSSALIKAVNLERRGD